MRVLAASSVIVAMCSSTAIGAIGDQWVLGIHHIDNQGWFTTYNGAGFTPTPQLPQSSGHPDYIGKAYGRHNTDSGDPDGKDSIARIFWELSGNASNSGRPVPTTTEQYTIEFFGTSAPANNDWQPIDSQFHGVNGEGHHGIPPWDTTPPFETSPLYDQHIPWNGAFNSNHQYMAADAKTPGAWRQAGPGPHTPATMAANASPNGQRMWLTQGSWLYAKWDYTYPTWRSWSAIRLTQVTGLAPPVPPEGDYNKNFTVDAADYVVWRKGVYPDADGFPDGIIDESDYFVWQGNFGNSTAGAGGTVVPEPANVVLLVSSLLGIAFARRRRPGK